MDIWPPKCFMCTNARVFAAQQRAGGAGREKAWPRVEEDSALLMPMKLQQGSPGGSIAGHSSLLTSQSSLS